MKAAIPGKQFKIIIIWFVINTVLGLIITLIVSLNSSASLLKIFIRSEVNSQVISSFSAAAGYLVGGKFRRMSFIPGVTLTILCVYPATLAGMALCLAFNYGLTGTGEPHIVKVLLLSLVLSGVITFIAFMTVRLSEHKSELEIKLEKISGKIGGTDKKSPGILSVKEKENYHTIKTLSIIYLSAHGKKQSYTRTPETMKHHSSSVNWRRNLTGAHSCVCTGNTLSALNG